MTEVGWEPGLEKMPDLGMWVRALEGDGMMVEPGMIGIVVNQFRSRACWDDVMPVVRWDDAYQCVYMHRAVRPGRGPRSRKMTLGIGSRG